MTQESAPGTEYQRDRPERHPRFEHIASEPKHNMELMHLIDTKTGEILQCDARCPAVNWHEWPKAKMLDVTPLGSVDPVHIDGATKEWLSLSTEDIMQKVGEYISWVETAMTRDVCKCVKVPHPTISGTWTGDTALDCPAHSREGLVLGFFEWLKRKPTGLLPDTAMGDSDPKDTEEYWDARASAAKGEAYADDAGD